MARLSAVVEPSKRVEFVASVTSSDSSLSVRWQSPDVNVTDPSLFSTPATGIWLVARAGALNVGGRYTLTITATDALGRTGAANVSVLCNRPPKNGTIDASPRDGKALDTTFDFRGCTIAIEGILGMQTECCVNCESHVSKPQRSAR